MENQEATWLPLKFALVRYKRALECLNAKSAPSSEQALEILAARDELERELKAQKQVEALLLKQIIELDIDLKQKGHKILKVLNLAECRESCPSPPAQWWWNMESKQSNWAIKGLTLIAWTGSLGLLANIASRFLSGGAGVVGAAAVIFPGFLTLLQAKGELTAAGREGYEKLIAKIKIPSGFREEAKLASLLVLFGFLVSFWWALPSISQAYNARGQDNYQRGQLGSAEENYLRAISLDTDNVEAHYNLGNLYEELQQFDKAIAHYLIAVKGNVADAYNNLGRLRIRKQEYAQAVVLLQQGLSKEQEQDILPEVKYSLYKNLGWARYMQGRDEEARDTLQIATEIASNPEDAQYIKNRGSAHCLLARVLERQKQPEAMQQWQECAQLASTLDSDEDTWLHQAQQKLQKAGK